MYLESKHFSSCGDKNCENRIIIKKMPFLVIDMHEISTFSEIWVNLERQRSEPLLPFVWYFGFTRPVIERPTFRSVSKRSTTEQYGPFSSYHAYLTLPPLFLMFAIVLCIVIHFNFHIFRWAITLYWIQVLFLIILT